MKKGMLYNTLASKGRYGDTELVHVTPQEKALLRALGGAGTINPETGLEEYWNPLKTIKKVGSNVTGAVGDLAGGAVDIAEDIGGGVVDLAGDILGGAGDVVQDVVKQPISLTIGTLKDIADVPLPDVLGAVEDVGGGFVDIVGDIGSTLDDEIISKIVDPVVTAGEQFEDAVREGVDEVDKLIQDPYVQLATQIFFPQAAPFLNAYATLDSGETLSASQIAAMAASGYEFETGGKLPSDIKKALNTSVQLAEGDDPIKVLVSAYGEDFLESSGIKAAGELGLQEAIGTDAYNLIKDNMDVARVGYDVLVEGKDPSEAIANRYGDEIVGLLGSDNPNVNALGYAGLKTAVALDQSEDTDEALLKGAKEYYDRGGQLPDFNAIADLTGISDFNVGIPDLGISIPELEGLGLSLAEIEGLGIDISGVDFPTADLGIDADLEFGDVDLGIDGVDLDVGDVDVDLPEVSIDLPEVETPEVELGDVDLGIEGPDLPEVDGPDISKPTLDLMQFAGLLGGLSTTGGGKAPTEEEQERSRYQTQFDFLAGLQPLGMLGNFQRRS